MLGNLIAVILFSVSMRTAPIQPNPTDYELTGGFSGQYGLLSVKHERENNTVYRGLGIKTSEYKKVSAEVNLDESSGINKQYIYKTLLDPADLGIFKIRQTSEWTEGKNYKFMLGTKFDLSTAQIPGLSLMPNTITTLEYDTNFYDRHTFRLLFSVNLIENERIKISPKYKIESYDGKNNWQFKTTIEIVL